MDPHGDPPSLTLEQESAIERAEKEAERAFARGDFECVEWLTKWSLDSEEATQLAVLALVRISSLIEPRGWSDPPAKASMKLRDRLEEEWREHCVEEALRALKDAKSNAAIERAEREYDEARIEGRDGG